MAAAIQYTSEGWVCPVCETWYPKKWQQCPSCGHCGS